MADNVAITAGSGTNIATDDVSSVHYQKMKLDAGGDGVSVPVVAGQQTMAASVPVVVASDQSALPVSAASLPLPSGAATSAKQDTMISSLGTLAGAIAGSEAQVDVVSSALPTGAATSAKQDSEIALLAGGLPAALGSGGGLKVDGSGTALPVSAASLPLPSGAATSAKQDTMISSLGTLAGAIAGSEAQVDVVSSALPTGASTLAEQQSQTSVLGATSDAKVDTDAVGSISAKMRGLVSLMVSLIAKLPAALGANGGLKVEGVASGTVIPVSDGAGALTVDSAQLPSALAAGGGLKIEGVAGGVSVPVTVSSGTRIITGSVTRPADTTAYAAGDAVTTSTSAPAAIEFTGVVPANGGTGTIYSAQCIDSANQSTKPQLELWVFAGTAAPTPDNDNSAYTPSDAELANLVGIFEFNAWFVGDATSGAGGNCVSRALNQNMGFDAGASVDDLYGLVVVRNAYTPVSQESFTFILHIGAD